MQGKCGKVFFQGGVTDMGALSEAIERREHFRAIAANNEIRGLLTRQQNHTHQPFLVWDVSETGLGIWSAEKLGVGDEIRVTIAAPFLLVMDCEVRWCTPRSDGTGFHIGVKVLENFKRLRGLVDMVARSPNH
jgi:hypothetical protein